MDKQDVEMLPASITVPSGDPVMEILPPAVPEEGMEIGSVIEKVPVSMKIESPDCSESCARTVETELSGFPGERPVAAGQGRPAVEQ